MTQPEIYSYSRCSSYYGCEAEFKLAYIDGVENQGNWFGSFGSAAHLTIEKNLKGEIDRKDMYNFFAREFENIDELAPFSKMEIKWRNEAFDYFQHYYKGFSTNVIGIEEPFYINFPNKDYWFRGIIDLYGTDKHGNYVIIDHKSADPSGASWNTKDAVKQLYLYSMYIFIKHGKFPTKLIYNFFRKNTYEIIDFNMNDFKESVMWLHDTIENIRKVKSDKEHYFRANRIEDVLNSKKEKVSSYDFFFCNHLCGVKNHCSMYKNLDKLIKLRNNDR